MAWEELVNQGQFKFIPTSFSWEESAKFAHLIDGYAIMGDKLGPFANEMLQYAEKKAFSAEPPKNYGYACFLSIGAGDILVILPLEKT